MHKQLIYVILMLLLTNSLWAQAPQGFSFQGSINEESGNPLSKGSVTVKISILEEGEVGNILYIETHSIITDEKGGFNLNIGEGKPLSGNFTDIDWGLIQPNVKIDVATDNNPTFKTIYNSQLKAVPFAMYAQNTRAIIGGNNLSPAPSGGASTLYGWSGKNVKYALMAAGSSLCGGVNWITRQLSNNVVFGTYKYITDGSIATYYIYSPTCQWNDKILSGNFLLPFSNDDMLVTSTDIYVPDVNAVGGWYSTSYTGTPLKSDCGLLTTTGKYVYLGSGNFQFISW